MDTIALAKVETNSTNTNKEYHQQLIFSTSKVTLMFIAASSFTRYRVTYGMGIAWQVVLVLHT